MKCKWIKNEWIEISKIKMTLKEKENIICELMEQIMNWRMINKVIWPCKVNVLNVRINEYHEVIQELNDQIISLSDSLSSLKVKLNF